MRYYFTLGFLIIILVTSCKSDYKFILNAPQKIASNKEFTINLSEKNDKHIDSVQFLLNDVKIPQSNNSATINPATYKLGKQIITSIVFFEGKTEKIINTIYFLAENAPNIYTYKVINTFPHDKEAYTQGLEYYNGFLYEGTGKKGESSIRKTELITGKVLQKKELESEYFGEGITLFNSKIFQLTWRGGKGFVYDLNTFERKSEFKYSKSIEGWGLTNNGEKLLKSDGTERIWILNPDTLIEEDYIEAYTNQRKVENLNELEYINGLIYANIWQQNTIVIINPLSGKVEGVANLDGLRELVEKNQKLDPNDDVLNGIAYDKVSNRLFVTGKHWNKLFEIELIKK
ncbi:glutaminyl-peptide cyclotransferase [Lutibacter sp.]|uniref:glutaminyl-peptide cyclotransferase n=1 Tax=Lutibacter sp. TaxID=1925666 RepID=UPI0027335297|nr:glutaminyl-peptide cyclotransferase [Lutibacter sp.]MDP3311986.1 glutaminyl-peptide cyclotransferase [Lutibacter sp.]